MVDLTANATQTDGEIHRGRAHSNAAARALIFHALRHAGLEPVVGEGVEQALSGVAADRDATALEAAVAEIEQLFGRGQCANVADGARRALLVLAARQASGIAVPELSAVWATLLWCADRDSDVHGAMRAANGVRSATTGGMSPVGTADLLAKYPAVDALLGVDSFDVDIAADNGAAIWLDFQPVGTAPARLSVPAGEHIVAAAKGSRRGSAMFTSAPASTVTVELAEQRGRWAAVAAKIARLRGSLATSHDIGWILDQVDARVALVRRGDTVQAWGRAGAPEQPRPLGGAAGERPITDADRIARVLAQEVRNFSSRAPDPDRPLLVAEASRRRRPQRVDESTPWWVYAAIGASVVAGGFVIYLARPDRNTTALELRIP